MPSPAAGSGGVIGVNRRALPWRLERGGTAILGHNGSNVLSPR
jgi:hypothetical protein